MKTTLTILSVLALALTGFTGCASKSKCSTTCAPASTGCSK
jgi:hypothetical protein